MTVAPVAPAAPVATPMQYVVPRVHGDPAAARALASSYRTMAEEIDGSARTAARILAELSGSWTGRGRHASQHPAQVLMRNTSVTTRALHEAADALDGYAHKLEAAHHHHFFSMHKLIAVAAVVTVTAVAVVVTMGAAAAAEAALAASAAGEATAAAGAAAAASSGAAAGLLESTAGLVGVRALLAFVVPHLVQAELSAGFAATMEESVDGHLDWHEIGTAAGAGFAGSAGAASAARVAQSVRFAKETWPLLHALLPHLGQAAGWAGVDAGQQELGGSHLSLRELLLSAGLAGAGSAMSTRTALTAHAYFGRQSAEEMLTEGVDLSLHEGGTLGHTLTRHVDITDADLRARITLENRHWASRFFDTETASRAIDTVLRQNQDRLLAFEEAGSNQIRLRAQFDGPVGVVMDRSLSTREAYQVVVRLARDTEGVYVLTAYPELPRP